MASSLDLSFCFLISIVLFLLLSLFKWLSSSSSYNNNNKSQKNLPPSPPKFPIFGNLHQLGLLPHRSLQSLSKKYGPVMLLHLGCKPLLVVSSVDAAYHVMKTHDLVFSDRPKTSITDKLFYNSKDIAFSPYGEYWRQVKSLAMLHLLSNKRVQSFRHVREEETSLMVEKIRQICSSSSWPSSVIINLSDLFITLTNDIVCRVAAGRKHSDWEDGRKTIAYLKLLIQLLDVFNVGDYIPWLGWVNRFNDLDDKVKKTVKHIDGFLETVIEEHINCKKIAETDGDDVTSEAKNSDFVDILLEFQRENLTGFALEREALKAIMLDMFVAGTDTTHAVINWAMAELLRNPKILQKLQTEVRQLTQEKSQVTEDDLEKMKYLKAVIKETLRLHSPTPLLLPRQSTQHVKFMGYEISAGTQVVVNVWAIARDPLVWKNPDEFQPERFLSSTVDFRGFNFEFIPFGAGRRGCPGINFSIVVNELALANLVKAFDFALPDGIKPQQLDMTESSGITAHRKLPLFVVATPYSL